MLMLVTLVYRLQHTASDGGPACLTDVCDT